MVRQSTDPETSGTHRVIGNTSALLILQLANYVLPLVVLPYLTRVLGIHLYGVVAFSMSMVIIATTITDFGFSLSATEEIAQTRQDVSHVRDVVGAVFIIKFGLVLFMAGGFALFLLFNTQYAPYRLLIGFFFLSVIGQTFQPVWFFQGIEKMAFITAYTTLARLVYIVFIFWWVTEPADIVWVAVAHGISFVASGALACIVMVAMGFRPTWRSWRFTWGVFKHSTSYFWARASVAIYTAGSTFFLGLVGIPSQVALYSAAEQLYKAGQSLITPLVQALFPHMSRKKDYPLLFKVLKWSIVASVIGSILGAIVGSWALSLIFGSRFSASYPILLVFLAAFVVTTPSFLLGYPFLGSLGQTRLANISVLCAGAIQLVLLVLLYLGGRISGLDVALSVLVVEAVVLALRIFWGKYYYSEGLSKGALDA